MRWRGRDGAPAFFGENDGTWRAQRFQNSEIRSSGLTADKSRRHRAFRRPVAGSRGWHRMSAGGVGAAAQLRSRSRDKSGRNIRSPACLAASTGCRPIGCRRFSRPCSRRIWRWCEPERGSGRHEGRAGLPSTVYPRFALLPIARTGDTQRGPVGAFADSCTARMHIETTEFRDAATVGGWNRRPEK